MAWNGDEVAGLREVTDGQAPRPRLLATIEYPTGMNQGGDPSQAWIKIKPDGRVDVFSGTVDIGQGSQDRPHPDRRRHARRAVRLGDDGQLEHRLLAVCSGTFASRGTFIGGNAIAVAADRVASGSSRSRRRSWRSTRRTWRSPTARSFVKGAPERKICGRRGGRRGDLRYGELIAGSGRVDEAAT